MRPVSDRPELFLLPDTDGVSTILYAPLHDVTARVNKTAVVSVSKALKGLPLDADDEDVVAALAAHGIFDETPAPTIGARNKPTQVTLFLSDGCNLRCRYCYAGAATQHSTLPVEAGFAAIDRVIANARELGSKDFVVGFHGNGEPFTAFPLMKRLCAYAEDAGGEAGLQAKFNVATNGVLDDEQLDFLIEHFAGANISFDGLPELQDRQRPRADGSGSFEAVDGTLRRLDGGGLHFGIRTTITEESVGRIGDIVTFVLAHYPHCDCLNIEPVWECGRCLQTGVTSPDTQSFIDGFLFARELVSQFRAAGLPAPELSYSAARRHTLSSTFCGVADDGFTVTTHGDVTACFEVCDRADPRAERFIYGHFDPFNDSLSSDSSGDGFTFDDDVREKLHRLTVQNMPHCKDCFCKFHCAGDCAAKVLRNDEPELHRGSERCEITRALLLDSIQRTLNDAERYLEKVSEDG